MTGMEEGFLEEMGMWGPECGGKQASLGWRTAQNLGWV